MIKGKPSLRFRIFLLSSIFISLVQFWSNTAPIFEKEISTGEEPSSRITRHRLLKVEESKYGYILVVMGLLRQGEATIKLEDADGNKQIEQQFTPKNSGGVSFHSISREKISQTYVIVDYRDSVNYIYVALVKKLPAILNVIVRLLTVSIWLALLISGFYYLYRKGKITSAGFFAGLAGGLLVKSAGIPLRGMNLLKNVIDKYSTTTLEFFLFKSVEYSIVDFLLSLLMFYFLQAFFERRKEYLSVEELSASVGFASGFLTFFVLVKVFAFNIASQSPLFLSSDDYIGLLSVGMGQSYLYLIAYIFEFVLAVIPFSVVYILIFRGVSSGIPSFVIQGMILLSASLFILNLFNSTGFYLQKPAWIHLLNLLFSNLASLLFCWSANRFKKA